jgi:hypothetical protein
VTDGPLGDWVYVPEPQWKRVFGPREVESVAFNQLLKDAEAFHKDPAGVSDKLVARIKTTIRKRYPCIPAGKKFKIGPNPESSTGVWVVFDDGNPFYDDLMG